MYMLCEVFYLILYDTTGSYVVKSQLRMTESWVVVQNLSGFLCV